MNKSKLSMAGEKLLQLIKEASYEQLQDEGFRDYIFDCNRNMMNKFSNFKNKAELEKNTKQLEMMLVMQMAKSLFEKIIDKKEI